MHYKTFIAFLFIILASVSMFSCKEQTEQKQPITQKIKKHVVDANDTNDSYFSRLRPNEILELGKVYTDTVNYFSFNDDYDYWMYTVIKGKDTIRLLNTIKQSANYNNKDQLFIEWKMDSFRPAGDDEFLDFSEFLISSEKLSSSNHNTIMATLDTVSISEIKSNYDQIYPTIFEYYAIQQIDEIEVWSDKMFGRCCTEADLAYSELLYFDITTNIDNDNYPYTYLSDQNYSSAFVFNEGIDIAINLTLNRHNDMHMHHTGALLDDVLKTSDTLLKPFKLSLVNGYTKSEKTFQENARVKTLQVYINGEYKAMVQLLDTPAVQEFNLDFPFFKNDTITLKPVTFYAGTTYDDVCISEIQSSLAHITHQSINAYYNIQELRNMNQVIQD